MSSKLPKGDFFPFERKVTPLYHVYSGRKTLRLGGRDEYSGDGLKPDEVYQAIALTKATLEDRRTLVCLVLIGEERKILVRVAEGFKVLD